MGVKKLEPRGIARNLSRLIKERRTSEADIAAALKLPVLTIRRLSSGETTDPHISTLKQLADHFQVSIDALIDDNLTAPVHIMNTHTKPHFLPILDWPTAAQMQDVSSLNLSEWREWHTVMLRHPVSEQAFVLKSKPSMHPRFPMGTLFTVDPLATPMDGDLIMIKMLSDGTLTLREICIDPPRWQLRPTSAGSDVLFYDTNEHQIIGPVVLYDVHQRSE